MLMIDHNMEYDQINVDRVMIDHLEYAHVNNRRPDDLR